MGKIIVVIVFVVVCWYSVLVAQYEDTGSRGIYFAKKHYTEAPPPTFAEKRGNLPAPILDDNPEYVDLYWKAWELAFAHFRMPPKGSPFVSNFIDEAFSPNIFQWDTIFMVMFARYAHAIFPAIQSLDNFYCRQYANGYICREIQEVDGEDFVFQGREHTVNPPLFAWAEVETYKITGDKSRFAAVLPVLARYAEWLETGRRKSGTVHGLYWQTGLGSGMDNSPRAGSGWTDMSAQMVIMYNALATICDELGKSAPAEQYRRRAQEIGDNLNRYMWNETDGLYYDVDDEGQQNKRKTLACFWPLLAQIATKAQAEKLVANLKDPKFFWRPIPFPSLAADDADYQPDGAYWRGSVWAPTNVCVIKGLEKYGYEEFATTATEKYLDGIARVYKKTGTIWENYAPEEFTRGVWSQPDFVGWSGCGPVQLLLENVLGFRPEGAKNRLTWRVWRIDRHGVEKLRFGTITAALVCAKRRDLNSPPAITVTSNAVFELVVVYPKGSKTFQINPGQQTVTMQ